MPHDETKFDRIVKLEDILISPGDSVIGYYVESDLKSSDYRKQKRRILPVVPEIKVIPHNKFTKLMNDIKPDVYTKTKKLICNWTDKKHCFIKMMLTFYVRRLGMVVDKIHE